MPISDEDVWAARDAYDRHFYAENDHYDSIRAVLESLAARIVPEWRPIETAPKDGCQIILFGDSLVNSGIQMTVAFWKQIPMEYDWVQTDKNTMKLQKVSEDGRWEMPDIFLIDPTHWMPLPAPPI
jgi:hypothetical protein